MEHRPGSSPLTREKRTTCNMMLMMTGAHPRSRGENTLIRADDKTFKGSSPLTRGKHERERDLLERFRLIPAHAGKTRGRRGCSLGAGAHPRSRGENQVGSHSAM